MDSTLADKLRLGPTDPRIGATETPETRKSVGSANATAQNSQTISGGSFADLLRAKQGVAPATSNGVEGVRFSAHAQTRLQSRNISLDADHLDRLNNAVQRAAGKGSRDALVLMDNMAMVVSVTNRTVVTVVDKDSLKQNVFTNIDSAVIA